ncbi:hypothetical protein, partial [Escherichia coli]|uniref:hypothetical protein n=1 Tax=Escherichia coli TaxID=562 RepID=UPI0019D4CE20
IRSYIARHLTAAAILPLPMYEIRALVNDAVNRGLFARGTRPFRHPAPGDLQSLETLTPDRGHPWVIGALAGQPAPGMEDEADEAEQALPRDLHDWDDPADSWQPDASDPVPAEAPTVEDSAESVAEAEAVGGAREDSALATPD